MTPKVLRPVPTRAVDPTVLASSSCQACPSLRPHRRMIRTAHSLVPRSSILHVGNVWHRRMSRFSRMLDLGGSPTEHSSSVVRTVNASKNCKIQAVCFDFDVLTKSVDEIDQQQAASMMMKETNPTRASPSLLVAPDMTAVQQVAQLLNVSLDSRQTTSKHSDELSDKEEQDLKRLMAMSGDEEETSASTPSTVVEPKRPKNYNPLDQDIRSKYAAKLAQKRASVTDTVSSDTSTMKGDASFHLAARAAAVTQGRPSTKWLAQSGTGALLQYLTRRSIRLALFSTTRTNERHAPNDSETSSSQLHAMQNFQAQVKSTVMIDVLTANSNNELSLEQLFRNTLEALDCVQEPTKLLVVSDRDDLLRVAKDASCVTCRIHRPKQPRGNVSAHYTVPSVAQVQGVVDEMNGISFNALNKTRL